MVMLLSKSFLISISVAKDVINGVADFMAAILPVLVTMIALAGGVTQAATIINCNGSCCNNTKDICNCNNSINYGRFRSTIC